MPGHTPQALLRLDETLGSRTAEAYNVAIEAHPYLVGVDVVLDTERGNSFHKSALGLPACTISINPAQDPYIERIESGEAAERYSWATDLLGYDGVTPRVPELITTIFLHELGHANDFQGYISSSNGDTRVAFDRSNTARKVQLATLPLQQASSRAVRAWENNTDGYRDHLEADGYDNEYFHNTVRVNRVAYAELPCEAIADRFALGVLGNVYTFLKQT